MSTLRRLQALEAVWTPFRTPAMQRVIAILAQELGGDAAALRDDVERLAAVSGMAESLETAAARMAESCGCTVAELMADAERIAALEGEDAA